MKKKLIRIIISLVLFIIALIIYTKNIWVNRMILLISYSIVGVEIIKKALKNIKKGKVFDENFLMSIATIGAFLIGEFPEAVAVMLFYQIGELFQSYAVDKSRKSIAKLMDIRPDYANVIRNGVEERIDPNDVKLKEIIVVKPGEKIPLDGIIVEGESRIETAALTGETIPKAVKIGDEVLNGCINQNGVIKIEVQKEYGESTVSKILNLVENANHNKAKSENFITKFAKYYTPTVVIIAIIIAILPPIAIHDSNFLNWIYRALSFLVVSCPCALVISIPLSFFGGIGGASKMGILVKGGTYIETLSATEVIVFDKTGTLTEGVFNVQRVDAIGVSKEELIKIAAHAENYSNHPIAKSIKDVYLKDIEEELIKNYIEIPGMGIKANIDNKDVLIGNGKLMSANNIDYEESKEIGTIVYIAINNKYIGRIFIADKIKKDSLKAIEDLKKIGIKKIIMLTGDKKEIGEDIANKLNIDLVYTELLPVDKVKKMNELLEKTKGKIAFSGDGINDAPVLALSDIGIAMGGLGSDAAIEAADIVIMTDEPSKILNAIKISKKTMKIVKQNIVFAILIKITVLILCMFGFATMWEAVFADVGVSIIAILNSLRMLRVKD